MLSIRNLFSNRVRIVSLLLILMLALQPISGLAVEDGIVYADFMDSYSANLTFINQNTGKHLIPLSMSKSNDEDHHRLYSIPGDVLSCAIRLDVTATIIESCTIVVTAPPGMSYGDSTYNDFCTSCYHSYALEMAMTSYPDAIDRYALVDDIQDGLKIGEGSYSTKVGHYRLKCERVDNCVTITFENENYIPYFDDEETDLPADEEEIAPEMTDSPTGDEPIPEEEESEDEYVG